VHHYGIGMTVLSKGAMDFCGSRFYYDTGSILGRHTCSRHYAEVTSPNATTFPWFEGFGLSHQFSQQTDSFFGLGS
jgi:hypothetical protein